ncbi:MAG: hypothetical protein OHK0046_27560 [Anaerolineae bacterium]
MTDNYASELHEARWELLDHINNLTDKFMVALAFAWLVLLIVDFTVGLNPLLQLVSDVIWVLFILDFVIEFIIAPHKLTYLRRSWLTALSLMLPALRLLRIFRAFRVLSAARTIRTVSLLRVMTSINRGMRALAETLGRRNIGYVIALTIIVVFVGAAGIAFFESPQSINATRAPNAQANAGLQNYGEAVWWTAMIMTSLGSEYWPQTVEGRILCWLLSLYALGVFGYLTAAFASYFIGVDQNRTQPETAFPDTLQDDLAELERLLARIEQQTRTSSKKPHI